MRELTVRIRFTSAALGSAKVKDGTKLSGRYAMMRTPDGQVMFLASWWQSAMQFAAQVFGRHQGEVRKIHWDVAVDGIPKRRRYRKTGEYEPVWYARYYGRFIAGKRRYSLHEAFYVGQTVSINCCVPSAISDEDFKRLMDTIGRYKGMSPYKHEEGFGMFHVVGVQPRKAPQANQTEMALLQK